MFDGKQFGIEIVGVVKGHIERSLAPLTARLDAIEKSIASLPIPKDGKDADVADVAAMVTAGILPELKELRGMVETLPAPAELPDIPAMIADAIEASKPEPVDFKALIAEAIAALPPAEKGKDADPVEVAALVKEEAERILAAWERPKDGKDGATGEKGMDGKDGKDGLDAVDVMIDREGALVFTMSDGRMKNIGLVVGRDGEAGLNGKDGAAGADGKNGLDGVGFDDMDLVVDEEGVMIKFVKGENVKSFRIPVPVDRGVFKEGTQYHKGAGVTYGGHYWIAQEDTKEKPDSGKGWRMAVRKGRDAKDGEKKPAKTVKVG